MECYDHSWLKFQSCTVRNCLVLPGIHYSAYKTFHIQGFRSEFISIFVGWKSELHLNQQDFLFFSFSFIIYHGQEYEKIKKNIILFFYSLTVFQVWNENKKLIFFDDLFLTTCRAWFKCQTHFFRKRFWNKKMNEWIDIGMGTCDMTMCWQNEKKI